MIDKESLDSAVSLVIAREIIGNLGTEYRDQLLQNSIVAVLKDWSVKHKIEQAVAESALAAAQEVLQTETYQALIRDAVRAGIERYTQAIPDAIAATLVEVFHGKNDGNYGSGPGVILKHLISLRNKGK